MRNSFEESFEYNEGLFIPNWTYSPLGNLGFRSIIFDYTGLEKGYFGVFFVLPTGEFEDIPTGSYKDIFSAKIAAIAYVTEKNYSTLYGRDLPDNAFRVDDDVIYDDNYFCFSCGKTFSNFLVNDHRLPCGCFHGSTVLSKSLLKEVCIYDSLLKWISQ